MRELTYKEQFIAKHGEIAYIQKLKENAAWRKKNPEKVDEYSKARIPKSMSSTILLISDLHIGASSVDIDEIKLLARNYWKGKPIILLGDLADLGLDRGMEFDSKINTQAQIDLVDEIFSPLDVRAYCEGNHCDRVFKKTGLQPYKKIFGMRESHELIFCGRKIYFNHGRSVAQDAFNEHQRYIKWCDHDVIALGHSHVLARISFLRGEKIQHLIRTGGFLGRSKYVENAGFNPLIRGWVEYNADYNFVHLKALTEEGEVYEI